MATPASHERIPTCGVCNEALHDTHILTCYHNFCGNCVTKIDRIQQDRTKGIACPLCRTFTPESKIKANFVVDEIIQKLKDKVAIHSGTEKICHQCDKSFVTSYCVNCNIQLCSVCKVTHRRIPNCNNHVITNITDSHDSYQIIVSKYCDIHPDSVIKFNCKPCDVAICMTCKIESHDTHKTESIDAAVNRLLPELRGILSHLQEKILTRAEKRVALDQLLNVLKLSCDNAKRDAHQAKQEKMIAIEQDYEEVEQNIQTHQHVMEKQIGLLIEDLDNSLSSIESMVQWGETLSATQGPAVLVELQGDVIKRAQDLTTHNSDIMSTEELLKENPAEVHFIRTTLEVDGNLVGTMQIGKNKIPDEPVKRRREPTEISQQCEGASGSTSASPVSHPLSGARPKRKIKSSEASPAEPVTVKKPPPVGVSPSTVSHVSSYRRTDRRLSSIRQITAVKEDSFKIRNRCIRFCHYKDILFFPCLRDKCIDCYSIHGEFLQSLDLSTYGVIIPHSVHPLTGDSLLVAAWSGLYEVGTGEGGECRQVLEGVCKDVHVSEGVVAVLVEGKWDECDRVHILQASDLSSPGRTITLTDSQALTVLLHQDSLCVSSGWRDEHTHICVYSLSTGELTSQYGRRGEGAAGELDHPRLSACDVEGGLLVVDHGSRRLQTLSARGEWAVLPGLGKVEYPCDAVIVGDRMLVLDTNQNVHAYKITYK